MSSSLAMPMRSQPFATYRVQLHAGFTLDDAASIIDYLAALGISHLYCSPYLQAVPGSTHGYDVVDPHTVNLELGGKAALDRLDAELRKAGLGQMLDIVPNHMAISASSNPWWWDVLENGPASRYASYFDVDWDPPGARYENQVLVPILGDQYGRVLEAGEIRVEFLPAFDQPSSFVENSLFTVRYYDNLYPVDPSSISSLLVEAAENLATLRYAQGGSNSAATLNFLAGAFERLPAATTIEAAGANRRSRDAAVLYDLLRKLVKEDPAVEPAIRQTVEDLNHDPDSLDIFLSMQNYRLAFWRVAARELGYRRFFDINTLIGLRVEDSQVFDDTHARILDWLQEGRLDGLRVDHPDGLRDPEGYFERLHAINPSGWTVIEKILEPGESLPNDWPVSGTTGYDFMQRANALFVDPRGEGPLTRFYTEFTADPAEPGQPVDWKALVHEKKLQVINQVLGSDINRLTLLWLSICERQRNYRDYTRNELHNALREAAACLPVYRTYIRAKEGQVRNRDIAYIEKALQAAKGYRPEIDPRLFDFLGDLLRLRYPGELENEFVMRFQQFTGPVMAKGVEDTAFYNYYRLISLNEVGGDPGQFGLAPEEWHGACLKTQDRWGSSLLASSTHDTKRSEDVRARINLLSEIPIDWANAVHRWSRMNAAYRKGDMPDRNDEYMLYQVLVGAWPIDLERLQPYLEKAVREAKVHSSWTDPDPEYEEALIGFAAASLQDEGFRQDFEAFVGDLILPGRINSLAGLLLKLTTPGIPDIYQGAELWTDALVDPDNRRPVDYRLRWRLLEKLKENTPPETVLEGMEAGLPKLWTIRQSLRLRRARPDCFSPHSSYTPLAVQGEPGQPEHAVAYLRGDKVAVVVPRLVMEREKTWPQTHVALPAGSWQNILTGERIEGDNLPLSTLLKRFPVALLYIE